MLTELLMEKPVRILLVDDHQIVLDGLANLLSTIPGLQISGKALDGSLALDFLEDNETDLLITFDRRISAPGSQRDHRRKNRGFRELSFTNFT
mgnify:CR=1 FL=1